MMNGGCIQRESGKLVLSDIVIITCFIRCWQNAAKYNHEVGLTNIHKSR